VCSPHTAPRPRCAPRKGSARRSLRRTAGAADRYARRDDSRSADRSAHARCAAPDRPVVQPLCPSGLVCGCSLACALTSWGLQARPSRGRLKEDRAKRRRVMLRYADPTECAQCALSFFCRPGSRADSAPARLSRCALGRGAPQSQALHRLRCAALAGAAPAAQRSLGHITGRAALLSGAGPGAARPSRRSLYSTTSTNACVSCVYERASEEISQTAPSLLCAQQSTVLLPVMPAGRAQVPTPAQPL
jgi:hypothetical protein